MEKNIFRILSLLLLANVLFPILMQRLPYPINTNLFWIMGWSTALILLHPKLIFSKKVLPHVILIGLFVFWGMRFESENSLKYLSDARYVLVSISLLEYFKYIKDYKGLKCVVNISLGFTFVSLITSIIGFQMYPHSVRSNNSEYYAIGIMGYSFFYGLSFVSPTIMFRIKELYKHHKIWAIIILSGWLLAYVKANLTTAFLFTLLGIFLTQIGISKIKKNKILLFFIIVLIVLPGSFYSSMMFQISKIAPDQSMLKSRLEDLALTLAGEEDTHATGRMERIPYLLNEISRNPVLGGGESTGHVYWLDLLSLYGFVGFLIFAYIFIVYFKTNSKQQPDNMKIHYYLSIAFFAINGFMKGGGGASVFYYMLFLMPAIGILKGRSYQNNYEHKSE